MTDLIWIIFLAIAFAVIVEFIYSLFTGRAYKKRSDGEGS